MADSAAPPHIIKDNAWNTKSSLERNPHFTSLKLAEEAAWQLVEQLPKDHKFQLVSINVRTSLLLLPSLYIHSILIFSREH